MSRIHEALQKARQQPSGSAQELPNVEEIISAGVETVEPVQAVASPAPSMPLMPDPAQLEALLPIESIDPILANCAKYDWPSSGKNMIFLSDNTDGIGQEQFRTLHSRLYQMRGAGPLEVVLVSSALPGEGKSFVSANLAHALALQSDRRALLIDADMRRGAGVSALLEAPTTPGLTDYLLGEQRVEDIIQTGSLERLYLIPCGRLVPKPGELIGSPKLSILLKKLRPLFDWIIIDTPPALPIADARVIADLSDGVLMVVNATATLSHLAKRAVQEFRTDRLLGVVLNRTSDPSATRYSAYGYGYAYGNQSEQGAAK